jgi:hypothetical protein
MSSHSDTDNTDAVVTSESEQQTEQTEQSEQTDSLKYIKDGYDYTTYAENFAHDEYSFYNIIKSYSSGSTITLSLKINSTVLSLSNLSENGMVTEYLRNDEAVNNTFNTIFAWVKNYYESQKDVAYVLDNVYIGDDDVHLWNVLDDMKASDDEIVEDELQDKAEEDELQDKAEEDELKIEELRLSAIMNILCMFNVCVVIVYALTVIVAIDTHQLNPITYTRM